MERSVCFSGMEINMKKRGQTVGIVLFLAALYAVPVLFAATPDTVSYTHLRAHET